MNNYTDCYNAINAIHEATLARANASTQKERDEALEKCKSTLKENNIREMKDYFSNI